MKRYIALLTGFLPFCLSAQMLDNSKGFAFTELPYFNEQFVKNNRIKTLNGHFQYKKTGDIIRESKYIYRYEFDRKGHLIYSLETKLIGTIVDTVVLYYEYDEKNNLSVVRQKDAKGFFSTRFTYDDKDRVIKEEYYRDIDTTTNNVVKPQFERSTYLNSERFEYTENPAVLKKTYFNNYDFPYLDEYLTYNDLGLLKKKEEIIRTTSQMTVTEYDYNPKGWVSRQKIYSPTNKNIQQEIIFNYDAQGNLTDKQIHKNGEHVTEIQLIYNSKTGILSYTLTRDIKTNFITILKIDNVEYF
ncbi:MAG: hypothetical protein J0G96_01185 [Flavobacteriia bacterium]|nr:hypothetical protein [Flavobacteriia bacterium]